MMSSCQPGHMVCEVTHDARDEFDRGHVIDNYVSSSIDATILT
jgi:hypothetical protein